MLARNSCEIKLKENMLLKQIMLSGLEGVVLMILTPSIS
ncbi:hypothetical protein bthur0007_62550 [Bacillus thuringiensis serovar monterrey BGSC 4AJ1]|nr:hypothetical protein bthur0007_62550 [Bacillus thuringiensis serovar monterrey BGSC 4AJ1]